MEMYLFARLEGIIFFIFLIGGEMMRFLFVSFKLIYSSKYSRSSLVLVGTFTLLVSILDFRNLGGVVSFAPPSGEPTLAQALRRTIKIATKKIFFIEQK